jgi:hypothetical protein
MQHYYHVREENLLSGTVIQPGRWGETVIRGGGTHPYFFREHLLELWRREKTNIGVSRFACTFAFEDKNEAVRFSSADEFVLKVIPANLDAPRARLDMLWLTWMSESGATTDKIAG